MIKIISGIYQLQLPIPQGSPKYVNTYLVEGDSGYLLIDTGWDDRGFDSLKEQLTEIGIGFEDIAQIVITHTHPDHYSLASRLKQLSGATLALHYLEIGFIESRYTDVTNFLSQLDLWLHTNGVPLKELAKFRKAFLKMTKAFAPPVLPDITLRGGETISTGVFNFQVLWTPGHSSGHISLYEPTQKILFTGDHILPTITPNIGLLPQASTNPLDDYLNSLNQLKQLEVNLILPGHESPFTGLQARVEELIEHHEQRNAEILGVMEAKPKTAYRIATEMTWMSDIKGMGWENLDSWNKRLAVSETVAHLESMQFAGKLNRFYKDSTIYYRILDTAK